MKTLRAFTCSLAALIFSAMAHAAPVQYQLTAYHTYESSMPTVGTGRSPTPVNPSDYFFADGTFITATFYYDSAVPPTSSNIPTFNESSGTYTALTSRYLAFSNLNLQIGGQSIQAAGMTIYMGSTAQPMLLPNTSVVDSDNSSDASRDSVQAVFFDKNLTNLSFGDYQAKTVVILLDGYNNMISNQSLPNTLTELNPYFSGMVIVFQNSTTGRSVIFSDGSISQVPLPSSALFFLSGLIGLGANIFKKAKK